MASHLQKRGQYFRSLEGRKGSMGNPLECDWKKTPYVWYFGLEVQLDHTFLLIFGFVTVVNVSHKELVNNAGLQTLTTKHVANYFLLMRLSQAGNIQAPLL